MCDVSDVFDVFDVFDKGMTLFEMQARAVEAQNTADKARLHAEISQRVHVPDVLDAIWGTAPLVADIAPHTRNPDDPLVRIINRTFSFEKRHTNKRNTKHTS